MVLDGALAAGARGATYRGAAGLGGVPGRTRGRGGGGERGRGVRERAGPGGGCDVWGGGAGGRRGGDTAAQGGLDRDRVVVGGRGAASGPDEEVVAGADCPAAAP